MIRTFKRLAKHESGQAMAEFTVIFPWVLIFFTVIMQLGSMWEAFQVVQLASWQAARYAAVHPGELQPNSPYDGSGLVGPYGVSNMELAAELVTMPISPVAVGRNNPVRVSFRCTTGNDARCISQARGLPLLPHTGPVTAPVYTAEIQGLAADGGNADIHHRYIYAHNMTTVKLVDLTTADGLVGVNACNRNASTFVGGGDETQHVIPYTGLNGVAGMGLGRGLIAVETSYMYNMYIPIANWVIFGAYGVLAPYLMDCAVMTQTDLTYPDDFSEADFGVRWTETPSWGYGVGDFWGKVRKLELDLADLEDIVDELANPLLPDTSARFVPRDVTDDLSDYLDRRVQFVLPLRTRTLVNLQALEDHLYDRDGDATTLALPY